MTRFDLKQKKPIEKQVKIRRVNNVECLIVSSSIDFSTDLISCELEKRGLGYLRLNRDQLSELEIIYSLSTDELIVVMDERKYFISPKHLRSVYFRAPVFLRGTNKKYTLEAQVYRSQWSSFIRNLILLESVNWVNHPVAIYRAENKIFQLKTAQRCGFAVPNTFVGNVLSRGIKPTGIYIVKSLEAALFYDDGQEMFTYTTRVSGKELSDSKLKTAPVIIQEYLENKIDIRVTIVGDTLFAVDITDNGKPISGDWRKYTKGKLKYRPINLPDSVKAVIKSTMRSLNLQFGGMDLAFVNDEYYFIEVNPTGEWGWLVASAGLPIDRAIVDCLSAKHL